MKQRNPIHFLRQCVEFLLFRTVLVFSGWLRRHSEARWYELVSTVEKEGTLPLGGSLERPYKPFKQESLESLTQHGFSDDSPHQVTKGFILPQWAKEIQPFLQNQLSAHTRRAYESDLKQFFLFLDGRISVRSLDGLRTEHIILYRKYLEEGRLTGKNFEKSTVNRKLAVVKSFLNWLKANHVVRDNPAQLVKGFPQNQESALKGLSDDEVRRMLELPSKNSRSGALHNAVLTSLLYLGLRKGELIQLRIGDLDTERGVPVVKVRGKGHRIRILPLTEAVRQSLDHYFFICKRDKADMEAPLFTPTKNPRTASLGKPLNPNAITYIVQRYAKKAGILKRISPHSCRATCISHALDRKATHRSVQHMAGWSTPLMIQRYDKRREDLRNSAAFLIDYEDQNSFEAPPRASA